MGLAIRVDAPLLLVSPDLFGRRMFLLFEGLHLERIHDVDHRVIEVDIIFQNLRYGRLLEYSLPRTFGLACPAIDTFIRMYIELVRELFLVRTGVLVDTIHRTNADTAGVDAIAAEAGNRPRHRESSSPIEKRTPLNYIGFAVQKSISPGAAFGCACYAEPPHDCI